MGPGFEGGSRYQILYILAAALGVIVLMVVCTGLAARPKARPASREAAQAARWHGQVDYIAEPDRAAATIDTWAKQTHGDSAKLNPEQRMWLDSVTAGHGARYLALRAEELNKKQSGSTPRRAASHHVGHEAARIRNGR